MMTQVALKFAASTLILGVGTVGCTTNQTMYRPAAVSAKDAKSDRSAAKLVAQAEALMRKQDYAGALPLFEDVVQFAPADVGYRMSLADLYLKNGRFASAKTTFSDVLALNPGNERAMLNLALTQIALGENYAATAGLERLAETAAPGNVGLAFALAGQPQRAIAMLEPAARAAHADARVRQNLALAYALAGDWQKARTTAAQDVSPADLQDRLTQWAAFAQPEASWTQVASLLGVTPAQDPGQPVRLALAPSAPEDTVALAAVETWPPAASGTADGAPVEVASAVSPSNPAEIESAPAPLYAEAVQSLVEAPAAVTLASASVADEPVPAFVPVRKAPRIAGASEVKAARQMKASRFVVQIGAYRSAGQVERAWARAHKIYPSAGARIPVSTTVTIPGRGVFHRLSVSGFGTQGEAVQMCGSIRAKGGACFVRANAGDAPVRWASRYSRPA